MEIKSEVTTKKAEPVLDEVAVRIACKVLKVAEGCNLRAYPDPNSDLYKALSTHGKLGQYMSGKLKWNDLEDHWKTLDGGPWTCGYGETNDVTKDTVYTQQEAESKLEARVRIVMAKCLKDCPKLALEHSERIAAITSMTYNIGNRGFATSTACKLIMSGDLDQVANAMLMWNKPSMIIPRRTVEANLWRSIK